MSRFLARLIALFPALFAFGLAFAEEEKPVETVGAGGIIAFFVVCIVLVALFVWLTNKSSKKSAEERAGDKLP